MGPVYWVLFWILVPVLLLGGTGALIRLAWLALAHDYVLPWRAWGLAFLPLGLGLWIAAVAAWARHQGSLLAGAPDDAHALGNLRRRAWTVLLLPCLMVAGLGLVPMTALRQLPMAPQGPTIVSVLSCPRPSLPDGVQLFQVADGSYRLVKQEALDRDGYGGQVSVTARAWDPDRLGVEVPVKVEGVLPTGRFREGQRFPIDLRFPEVPEGTSRLEVRWRVETTLSHNFWGIGYRTVSGSGFLVDLSLATAAAPPAAAPAGPPSSPPR